MLARLEEPKPPLGHVGKRRRPMRLAERDGFVLSDVGERDTRNRPNLFHLLVSLASQAGQEGPGLGVVSNKTILA